MNIFRLLWTLAAVEWRRWRTPREWRDDLERYIARTDVADWWKAHVFERRYCYDCGWSVYLFGRLVRGGHGPDCDDLPF